MNYWLLPNWKTSYIMRSFTHITFITLSPLFVVFLLTILVIVAIWLASTKSSASQTIENTLVSIGPKQNNCSLLQFPGGIPQGL